MLKPVLFNLFINDLDEGAGVWEQWPIPQSVVQPFRRPLRGWRDGQRTVKFSEGKCWVVHLGKNKLIYQHRFGHDLLERSTVEKELGFLEDNRLSVSQSVKSCLKKHPVLFCDYTGLHTTGHLILGWRHSVIGSKYLGICLEL